MTNQDQNNQGQNQPVRVSVLFPCTGASEPVGLELENVTWGQVMVACMWIFGNCLHHMLSGLTEQKVRMQQQEMQDAERNARNAEVLRSLGATVQKTKND